MPNQPEINLFFYPCRHHIKFSTLLDAAWYGHLWSIMSNTMRCSVRPACGGSYGRIRSLPLWRGGRPVGVHMVAHAAACGGSYGWGRLKPTGKNPRTPPRLSSTTTPRSINFLLGHARADAIVGAPNAGIKKKRDVEEESRGCSGGILYEQHKIVSSDEVSVVM